MPSTPDSDSKPRPEQMRLLRALAELRGESFAYPQTVAEADVEIDRMQGPSPSSYAEQAMERRAVSRDMANRGGATAIRDSEIEGYGSSAHWKVGTR